MMQPSDVHPPEWPLRFLRLFLRKEYLEEIEGDMEELFRENIERMPYRQARRIYVWETIKLLRPALLKNFEVFRNINQYPMFKNYFKVSFRGLMKNPLNSFINVFGLAMAIGICIFGYAFARWTYSTDQFHEHRHSVFLVTFFADRDGTPQQHGQTPRPLGQMLRSDFAHVRKVCRIEDRNVVMKLEDNVFHERVRYADPEFLEMFTFPLKWGMASSLKDVNSIILSREMAVKYFGDVNPVGQRIRVIFGNDRSKAFEITGVAEDFPKARTIAFDFLVNFENLRTSDPAYDFMDWKALVNATLIQVDDPSHLKSIEAGMERYRRLQNEAVGEDWAIASFEFEPLATLHERSAEIRDDISRSSADNYKSVIFISVIGTFLILLACFNYINIAIVSAARRLKEIGVRKSIGATRSVVVVQFLSENLVITFFAMVIGLTLGATVFIPGFERMWGSLDLDFRLSDPVLWMYLPLMLLFTSVASGIYPSLYISRFQVVGILKGAVKFGRKNPVTKIFLALQLVLACIFMTLAVMFSQNSSYLAARGWGYNPSGALYAVVPDGAAYDKLHALMSQEADVLSISGSRHHLGRRHETVVLHFPRRQYEVDRLSVGARYFETMGVKLRQGRLFSDMEGGDREAVIVNELLAKNMGWSDPVGKQFRMDSIRYEVIGVVNDVHSYSFSNPVTPTVFTVAQKEHYRYLALRAGPGSEASVFEALQEKWGRLFPETPFEGGRQEDVWGFYFEAIKIHGLVWRVFAFIAVALATLGLYGLITLNVEARRREFSIRKVLGAGLQHIAAGITGQYMVLFCVALAIGAPASYLLGKTIIEISYAYHMPITSSGVLIASSILVLLLLTTVSTQIRRIRRANPVEGLKVE